MLRYVSKFVLDILPSVVATVVGAYIVNHYISPKSAAEAPKAAAMSHVDSARVVSSPVDAAQPSKGGAMAVMSPSPTAGHDSAARESRTKAGDKALARVQPDKAQGEKGPEVAKTESKTESKAESKAELKTESEFRHFISRDKASEKASAPAETASIAPGGPDEHPDAAELARAALERLRMSEPARPVETTTPATVREAPREPAGRVAAVTATPAPVDTHTSVSTVVVPPLPPPVSVSPPVERASLSTGAQPETADPGARSSQSDRPIPPADIPVASEPPVDLQSAAAPPAKKKSVTDDMLSAARSVFQRVVPQ